ncbi:lysophosphatidylcholine acyltransferase isoform X1 [Zophobas morio]|uniref:lysophosphatidylcholine acyltransferase isoform X1 n=2 Tax=Zophobas morio TaxID=2755281 RepID=UPI003083E673
MNAKLAAGISHDSLAEELLNPFVHRLELDTTYEKIKTAVLTVVLLPIRVSIICIFLITGWLLACVGLFGLTEEDLRAQPLSGWRSIVRRLSAKMIRCLFTAGGFRLRVIGKQSDRTSAPVVALAPHSSFMDSIAMVYMGGPSIVAKGETASIPFFGKMINFTQPVYVWRDDPDSRQNTIKEIISRATSSLDWPQILIFPEGTCTNRSCLITFKPGAFYPGVPIQPVCIRYPNKLDTVTWTWEGPSALKLLWLTLTQPYSYCEIEFLPVYNPNEEEKRDPKLFANNVRAVMAKALGVPVSDYTYGDCKLMARAKEMNLPNSTSLVEVQKLRHRLSLHQANVEENLLNSNILCENCTKVTFPEFCKLLNLSPSDHATQHLFRLYDKNCTGAIDFRDYLLGVLALSNSRTTLDAVKLACKIYDTSGCGRLSPEDFSKALFHTLAFSKDYAYEIFGQVDRNKLGYITFDNFLSYAEKKAEFANLFSLSHEEKFIPRNGQICPNDYSRKID